LQLVQSYKQIQTVYTLLLGLKRPTEKYGFTTLKDGPLSLLFSNIQASKSLGHTNTDGRGVRIGPKLA
jgi:hypothetical protein